MISYTQLLILGALLLSAFGPVLAQSTNPKTDPFQNAFANPTDNPDLPRVLIIGDSISIGYTPRVRRHLDGKATIHRPNTNCRWSSHGAEHIEDWVGTSHWDVVHFNFGLWDWYGWKQEEKATPESYAINLENIVRAIRSKTDAKLIFGLTTPPCIGPEKKVKFVISGERAKAFNDAAITVMKAQQVAVNDLYSVIDTQRATYQRGEDDVHYNDAGRDVLAAKVAEAIQTALPSGTTPRVLLLGDSISIAYTPMVIEQLKGIADVSRPRANCGPTSTYLKGLKKWLGTNQWDIIHFNVGLHDLCYRHPDAKVYGKRDKVKGTISVPLKDYETNLKIIVRSLKATGAQLIWATTTKVPEGEAGRHVGDELRYNAVAKKIMDQHQIPINDLHALSATFAPELWSKPGDVHFQKAGSEQLAKQVVARIETVIHTKQAPTP